MANSQDFVAFVLEQLALFGAVSARRMFGGHGLYLDRLMFAIIDDDRLYFKADAESQPTFSARSLPAFTYLRAGKPAQLRYHEAPPEVFDDAVSMCDWARLAHAAALRERARQLAKKPAPSKSVSDRPMRNLGPKSREWLAGIGVHNLADLQRFGIEAALMKLFAAGRKPSVLMAYALAGALMDCHWQALPGDERSRMILLHDEIKQAHKRRRT